MTESSPVSNIPPCHDDFQGRLLQDFCRDCNHTLTAHRRDRVCSVCDAIATLRVDLLARIEAIEAKLR